MNHLVAALRLVRILWHVLWGLSQVYTRFPKLDLARREALVQGWSTRLLHLLGLRVQVTGQQTVAGPLLLVANHISWVDITVIHATRYCRFVSKADVKHWPIIGTLATRIGTLFIERESRRDAMRVVHHMAQSLQAGDVLAVFPEGTTSDGSGLLPFHANLLQAAIAAQAPIQPIAISFVDGLSGQTSRATRYVGDDSLIESIWRTLSTPGVVVRVNYGEPQQAQGRDRRIWAADLRAAIADLRAASAGVVTSDPPQREA